MPRSDAKTTRDRIVVEASRLFAAKGVKATTFADIESAVGLKVGSGGVHRYFADKDELLDAVFDSQLNRGRTFLDDAVAIPTPNASNLHEYVDALGRSILVNAEHGREVALILFREAHDLPESAERQRDANDQIAYGFMADALRERFKQPGAPTGLDPEALAFLFVGSLIFYRLSDWLTGEPKLGLTDERLLRTWTAIFEPILRSIVLSTESGPLESATRKKSSPPPSGGVVKSSTKPRTATAEPVKGKRQPRRTT